MEHLHVCASIRQQCSRGPFQGNVTKSKVLIASLSTGHLDANLGKCRAADAINARCNFAAWNMMSQVMSQVQFKPHFCTSNVPHTL